MVHFQGICALHFQQEQNFLQEYYLPQIPLSKAQFPQEENPGTLDSPSSQAGCILEKQSEAMFSLPDVNLITKENSKSSCRVLASLELTMCILCKCTRGWRSVSITKSIPNRNALKLFTDYLIAVKSLPNVL